jgi:hypothetical protein
MTPPNELPYDLDRDLARIEDALRRIGAKGSAVDRRTADQLAEKARDLAFDVASAMEHTA